MSAIDQDTRLSQLRADADACGPSARKLFEKLLKAGKTPAAAAMYACQQPPGSRFTDRAFCQGQRRKMEGMSPMVGGLLHKTARAAGIDTNGKYYMSGLGRATDPAAWVTCAQDVLNVAKERNLNVDGALRHQAVKREVAPKEGGGVAPDILNELEAKSLAADPALREKVKKNPRARHELRAALTEKHGRRKRPKRRRG